MAKRNKRKTLENKLDALCRETVKARDGGVCQKCGKSFDKMDTSHVIPRGSRRFRWDLKNLKLLCSRCHMWWWHDADPEETATWFNKKFPQRRAYLDAEKPKGIKRWTIPEMEEHIQYLKDMITYYESTQEIIPF